MRQTNTTLAYWPTGSSATSIDAVECTLDGSETMSSVPVKSGVHTPVRKVQEFQNEMKIRLTPIEEEEMARNAKITVKLRTANEDRVKAKIAAKEKNRHNEVSKAQTKGKEKASDISAIDRVLMEIAKTEASIIEKEPLKEIKRIIAEVNGMDESLRDAIEAIVRAATKENKGTFPTRAADYSFPTRAADYSPVRNIIAIRKKQIRKNGQIPSAIVLTLPNLRVSKSGRACNRLYKKAIERSERLIAKIAEESKNATATAKANMHRYHPKKLSTKLTKNADAMSITTASTKGLYSSRTSVSAASSCFSAATTRVVHPGEPDLSKANQRSKLRFITGSESYERLYNGNQAKKFAGKQRRQAIALASAKAKELPDFSHCGTIPLSQADDFYYKSVRGALAGQERRASVAREENVTYHPKFNFTAEVQQKCGFVHI